MQTIYTGRPAWQVTCELLAGWHASGEPPPDRGEDHTLHAWDEIRQRVEQVFRRSPSRPRITHDESVAIAEAVQQGPIGVHAAAWVIDEERWPTFARPWAAGQELELTPGDLYPVSDWDDVARPITERLSRPWKTQLRAGELPHTRRFSPGPADPPVRFDGRWFDELEFLSDIRIVGAAVLNAQEAEFTVPEAGFPIEADDPAMQVERACRAVATAQDSACGLLILPELAVPRAGVDRIVAMLRRGRRNLAVVAGSRHATRPYRRNIASLVTPSGEIIEFEKRERYWGGDVREGIAETRQPLRILVAGTARIAVTICKDFLVDDIRNTLKRCGANVIAVPSMSPTTDLHEHAAQDLAGGHGLSVVANGPLRWNDGRRPEGALVGRPHRHRALLRGPPDPSVGSVVLFDVIGSGPLVRSGQASS